ncbi:Uncharacterized protein dnl_30390 [Desulfonema limicola]|uniref:Uncharacterized protein n=1 Tax=Desulfonema limicola TaxID=45656 RepID=A0A975GGV8_9BACT|nr:Uncharacterized protein dnl_30390 [Desulfonema limicola]
MRTDIQVIQKLMRQFQSLFSWKYNCELKALLGIHLPFPVSILVFMEVQL